MKHLKSISILFLALLVWSSCSKEGPQGPTGPQGEQGPKGDTGPQGVPGNADVVLYNFGSKTFTGGIDFELKNISSGRVDSSIILAYYNPVGEAATAWYPIPGIGNSGLFEARYFIYQTQVSPSIYTFSVRLIKPDGSGSYNAQVTWRKTRIFLVKATDVISGKRKAAPPDFKDYYSVCRYYGIPVE